MGLRPGGAGAGLRPGGGSGLRPGGAPLGGGAGAGGGGAGGSGSGPPGGAAAVTLPQCNPVRPGAPPVPEKFVPMGQKDGTGRMIYTRNELLTYSGLTERCGVQGRREGWAGGRGLHEMMRVGNLVVRYCR